MKLMKRKKKRMHTDDETNTTTPDAPANGATDAPAQAPASDAGDTTKKKGGRRKNSPSADGKRARKAAPFKLLQRRTGVFFLPKKWEKIQGLLNDEQKAKLAEILGESKTKTFYTEIELPEEANSTGSVLKHIKKNAGKMADKNLSIVQVRDNVRIAYEEKVVKKTKAKLVREGDEPEKKAKKSDDKPAGA